MIICDCNERTGIEINSHSLFMELKTFFNDQVEKGVFEDIPVEKPYFQGYNIPLHKIRNEYKWYADKWYKCKVCGALWEFQYPDFPAKGFVRKFADGQYQQKEIGR